jgi:acetoin utilization protein AcuB
MVPSLPIPPRRADDADANVARAGLGRGRPGSWEMPMIVKELMTQSPITTGTGTPVLEARQLMVDKRIRHLLVTEGTKLLGIITDRDIRLNLPSPATSLSVWEINYLLARMTVDSAMTKSVVTVGPDQDAKEAAALMLDRRIGALPVLDGGRLIGIITETDLLRAFVKSS